MISVNQKFIDSCNSDYVLSQLKIKVSTNKAGTILCTLNDDEFNISSNSVEKQASSGAVCNVGGVCSNRIKIVLNQKGIEKLDAVDGFKKNYVLHLIQWNKVDDPQQSDEDFSENLDHSENETGKCDLGFYYISQIKNNYYDCELTCYDGMLAFEKNLTITQLKYMMTNSKTVDQWLAYFCTLVNDSNFNISYTDNADVTCNDGVSFTLSDDSSFDKIRDAISQLAMLKMAYATIDTQGNLTLKQAIKTNTSTYDDTVDNEYMFNSDNEVIESVVKYFYTSVAGFEYENTYTEEQGRNEINLYLEENKFLRGFEPYNGTGLTSQTLTCLRNMSLEVMGYSFYSCECDINERPYIELGDNIEVERKLVDQQGQVSTITLPLVVDSVSHEIGASTHLTSNSTVGTNEGSNTKTRINSQPKDPSNKDILNMLKSPVTKYTDETATVRIRLDDEYSENFDVVEYKNNYSDGDTSYSMSNGVYRLTNVRSFSEGVIYERETPEKLEGSYIYNSNVTAADIVSSKENFLVNVKIKSLSSLIGKEVLYSVGNKTNNLVTATITGIYFYKGSNATYNIETPLSNLIVECTEQYGFSSAINSVILSELFPVNGSRYDLTENYDYTGKYIRTNPISGDDDFVDWNFYVRSGIGTAEANVVNCVNPYIDNYDDIVKAFVFLCDIILYGSVGGSIRNNYIQLQVEYDYNNQHYSQYIALPRLLGMIGFAEGIQQYWTPALQPYTYDESYQFVADYVNNNNLADNYLEILNTIYENIKIRVYDCFIDATYLTRHAPLSQSDKNRVDLGLVNQNDLEGLREQIRQNTQAIENLEKYVDEVNADLQDTKQDIVTNAQNITALDTREAQDVSGLDTRVTANEGDITSLDGRVTALEQGGGGGGGTFVVANPTGQATADLTKLQVGSDIYSIPGAPNVLQVISKPSDNVGANYDIALVYRTINNVKVATELYSKMLLWFKQAEFESSVNSSYSDVASFDYTTIFDDVVAYANYTHGTGNSGNGLWTKGTITLFAKYTESGSEVQLTEGTDYTLTWTSTTQGSTKFLLEFEPNTYIYSLRIHLQNCYRCSVTCNYLIDNQILHDILNP